MQWKIKFTSIAEADLKNIYVYISAEANEEIAYEQINKIIYNIKYLKNNPYLYPIYDHEPWDEKGIRRIVSNNYSLFYQTDESTQTINIISIINNRQDLLSCLKLRFMF